MYVHVHVRQSTSNYMSVSNSMFSDTIHGLIVYAMVTLFFVIMYVQALNVILYVQVFRHILVSAADFAIASEVSYHPTAICTCSFNKYLF